MDDIGIDRKIVIVGATDVGKTSITMRYCHGSFSSPTSATIGASFLQKRVILGRENEPKRKMTLQIWDTAGQERFRSMAPMYYRNAKAAILVFDLHQEQTFEKIKEWLQDLRHHVGDDIVLALVGNKCDSPSEFEFTKAQEFAKEIGASVFKTSAKTGDGVHELFETVAMDLLKKHDEKEMLRKRSTPTNTAKPEDVLFLTDSKNRSSSSSKKSKCC